MSEIILTMEGTTMHVEIERPLTGADHAIVCNALIGALTGHFDRDVGTIRVGGEHPVGLWPEERALDAVVAAARRIERGCDCARYDDHGFCAKCRAMFALRDAIKALDKARSA